jgi:hypothetical protein
MGVIVSPGDVYTALTRRIPERVGLWRPGAPADQTIVTRAAAGRDG